MPTYEYVCPKCDHAFEFFQSMRDEPLTQCPKCRKKGVKRLIGITDYKKKASPEKSGGGDAAAAKAPAPAAPAKPAAPAAAK
ncbi:MAG: zinc ribbon domain-containing protein [Opitutales bacterium]|nr:zinc ribbon domain-containing protein [Opitutales bacterium]